jgi:hypothetical protein
VKCGENRVEWTKKDERTMWGRTKSGYKDERLREKEMRINEK